MRPENDSLGDQALDIVVANKPNHNTLLDVGCGAGHQTKKFQKAGFEVTSVDTVAKFDGVITSDYLSHEFRQHDVVWCSHTLEHTLETHAFIKKLIKDCKDGGIIAITVPPLKHNIVGGHVTLWNAGLLLYRMILAGLDCRYAKVNTYGYNVSVLVKKKIIEDMPQLNMGNGDFVLLREYFPFEVKQGFDGSNLKIDWDNLFKNRVQDMPAPVKPKQEEASAPVAAAPKADNVFEWRKVPEEFENNLPKHLYWIRQDTGAWGNWPSNGPIAELYKHGNQWIEHCKEHRTCIQAGGNCGMYASWYGRKFKSVYTFEPDPVNFKCLRANSRLRSNINYFNCALGHEPGNLKLKNSNKTNVGTHKIDSTGIPCEVRTIDSMNIADVDLIHLDIEGYEDKALQGASDTIIKYKPVIVSEKDIFGFLEPFGYKKAPRAHDHVYIPK